jgi:predicted SAM-dependent methyltransferase
MCIYYYKRLLKKISHTYYKIIYLFSLFLNFIRRKVDYVRLKFLFPFFREDLFPIVLNLGCGNRRRENAINIDLRKTKVTDFVADITNLPLPKESVKKIESYHLVEHLPWRSVTGVFENWYEILIPGGELVIECPDFDQNVKDYLSGKETKMQLFYIFGRQRFPGDTHHFGYNFERLKNLLKSAGFRDIKKEEPQDYHKKEAACLRVEAFK